MMADRLESSLQALAYIIANQVSTQVCNANVSFEAASETLQAMQNAYGNFFLIGGVTDFDRFVRIWNDQHAQFTMAGFPGDWCRFTLRITLLESNTFSEGLQTAAHDKLLARFDAGFFNDGGGHLAPQDTMPGDCSAGNRRFLLTKQIPFAHSRTLVTVNENQWVSYMTTAFRVDLEYDKGVKSRLTAKDLEEEVHRRMWATGRSVSIDEDTSDGLTSTFVTVTLDAGFQELRTYWEQQWQLPALKADEAVARDGMEQVERNLALLRQHVEAFLQLHDPHNVGAAPHVLILVIGNLDGHIAKQLMGKIDGIAGAGPAVWSSVARWFKEQPHASDVADPVLSNFLDMSLDSNGVVWADAAVQRCAENLPNGHQDRKEELQKKIRSLAGRKKGMLILNEKMNAIAKATGTTVNGLGAVEPCHAWADFSALKLNAETERSKTPWTLLELSGNGCMLHKPWPFRTAQKTKIVLPQ
mmetsp:Transcript_46052/g.103276  ORF Transcript_46052/g.103276 Transcript_46052/m.103276 type:complete len:471 (+) Transcript_46052:33-1445(+)